MLREHSIFVAVSYFQSSHLVVSKEKLPPLSEKSLKDVVITSQIKNSYKTGKRDLSYFERLLSSSQIWTNSSN